MNSRHLFLPVVALLLLTPITARAQLGMNLSWDDCGTFGTSLKAFSCDTNSGKDILYVSARSDVDIPLANGVEVDVRFYFANVATVSPWWHLEAVGCRAGSVTGQWDFTTSPHSCYDLWQGAAFGGVDWQSEYLSPSTGRLRGIAAIEGTTVAPANTEMYLIAFAIDHTKTTGTGACAGCADPACIVLNSVKVTQPCCIGDFTFTTPLNSNFASWACPTSFPLHASGCTASCSVPTLRNSWGTIKSLYR